MKSPKDAVNAENDAELGEFPETRDDERGESHDEEIQSQEHVLVYSLGNMAAQETSQKNANISERNFYSCNAGFLELSGVSVLEMDQKGW